MKRCDLHTHSVFSDGTFSPEQIIDSSIEAGLSAIALTDHNTVSGLPGFMSYAKGKPIDAVPETEHFKTSRGHALSADQIVGVIKKMAKPNHVGYQDSSDRFFEVVHYGKKDNRIDVVAFFDLDQYESPNQVSGYKSNSMKYDVVVTLFPLTKEEKKGLIKNNYIIMNKNKKGVLQLTSGKNLPPVLNDTPFYENSITDSDGKSNPSTQKNSDRFTEIDRDYLSAVERGDMETAQRMVDEAARAAGYDMHLYHGSKSGGGFTVFKGWQYRQGAFASR